jgi:transcriptional regulator with XRE-family HTH domain
MDKLTRIRLLIKWIQFIKSIKQKELAELLECNKSYLSQVLNGSTPISDNFINKVCSLDSRINKDWIYTGVGSMAEGVPAEYSTKSINEAPITKNKVIPVIPADIYNEPEVDVYEYVLDQETDTAPAVKQFPKTDMYYRIKSRAMEPNICAGDVLALTAYPQGQERIIPGDVYVLDTNTNGLTTRLLYNHPDGFLARSYNPEKYPDFVINRDEIIRIFRIVGLLRINVQ